jgi:hypothetical protein
LEHVERAEVIVIIPRTVIRNPGSWSHKAAEEFTDPAREEGKESALKAPPRLFDASLPGIAAPLPTFRVLAFETQKGRAAAANLGTTLCAPNYF